MREEAELEVKALEERLAEIDGEKGELMKELEAMKSILANTSDDDSVGKKTVERLVYQVSCRKCNKHGSWIGTTHDDIKETIDGHIRRVVEEYADGKGKSKSSPSKGSTNSSEGKKIENWSKSFAEHFARHCKPKIGFKSVTEKEIRKFCRANIKIEVLRRQDGTDLMWECEEE
jgi:phage regulator Rha-like protein